MSKSQANKLGRDKLGRPRSPIPPNNKPLAFKGSAMKRAIRAVQEMGLCVGKIEVDPATGKIAITPGTPADTNTPNEWDTDGKASAQAR
jgi:hypothetical protein